MGLIEGARRNLANIVLATSVAVGVPGLLTIGDGVETGNIASSIVPIVRGLENPAQSSNDILANTSVVNLNVTTREKSANAASDLPNYSLLHRSVIGDIIQAIRSGEDSASILARLKELEDLAHRELAIGVLGFVGASVIVEVSEYLPSD